MTNLVSEHLVNEVEKAHFRTHQDTGANPNALLIWNLVRRAAGLQPLTMRDLMVRAADDYHSCWRRYVMAGDDVRAEQYLRAETIVLAELKEYDEGHKAT